MLFDRYYVLFVALIAGISLSLTACTDGSTSESIERSLAPDPQLQTSPQIQTSAELPADFPKEIPVYPEAKLQAVEQNGRKLRWTTADPINFVQSFYQKEFQSNNWQIIDRPTDDGSNNLVARRNDLQVNLSIAPFNRIATPTPQPTASPNLEAVTELAIEYSRTTDSAATPQPGGSNFVGPVPSPDVGISAGANASTTSANFNDLNSVPAQLRQYIEDLAALGVLTSNSASPKSNSGVAFEPNQTINRRLYAQWLVTANNQIYANSPGKQIRLASPNAQPAFQDVPSSDRDFALIQGLAEAGLIPSPLSGNSTAVLFRPDAPLTRENLLLWKVPLDTRQALPNASVDAVKQTWGFQDAARIDPLALRAVLADFQNGEQANIRRSFGYTTLLQPKKTVTRAEAAATLWHFGYQGEGITAKEALTPKPQPSPAISSSPTPESTP